MKETSIELKAGKGVRVFLNDATLATVEAAIKDIRTAWDAAENVTQFWNLLDWPNTAEDAKYGDRKWIAVNIRGEEFRVTVANKRGELALDFRTWWS